MKRTNRPALLGLFTLVLPLVSLPCLADPVLDWNNAALNAIRADRTSPPKASRALAIAHIAIHDAVCGFDHTYRPYAVSSNAPAGASRDAAIAAAGYTTLYDLFTNADIRSTNLAALYNAQLAAIPNGPAKTDGLAWGQWVAQAILALRASDGSTNVVSYTPGSAPGDWRPTPPAYAPALLPQWPGMTPFALVRGDQLRPPAPPPVTSAAYSFEFNTVKQYGAASSTARTANQTEVALFWADGAGTATPPGHWNVIAQGVATAHSNNAAQNARLFALLNIALADAAIVAWDAKYAFNYWRPIAAIREADTDGNPETDADPAWAPLIVTPPFPEYISGHSTFSRAAATVLAGFFGTDAVAFTTTSDGLPGVTRNYASFGAAADESGISRLYGGIHWPSGNIQAQNAGHHLGRHVLTYLLQPVTALQFTRVRRAGDATQLELTVEPNRPYLIRASTDLNTWEDLAVVSSPSGNVKCSDLGAPQGRMRFYVAVGQ